MNCGAKSDVYILTPEAEYMRSIYNKSVIL
jgi:hypothetical protein